MGEACLNLAPKQLVTGRPDEIGRMTRIGCDKRSTWERQLVDGTAGFVAGKVSFDFALA